MSWPCCPMLLRARSNRIGDRKYRDGAGLSMRKIIAVSIAAGSFIILADPSRAADRGGGAQLAAMCASCHRLDAGNGGIPTILGMSPEMLTRAMLAYRSRERPSHIMRAIALSLSDEEIATVAHYLAALNKQVKP